ncbi:MAG: hypothetical protein HQK96_05995 [Nitrospirae bacterium]|nr:hypothetical protein [Nitrospirota bacterium]MBF0554098.1 hypothetical protein [Nitrospirota bacterium]
MEVNLKVEESALRERKNENFSVGSFAQQKAKNFHNFIRKHFPDIYGKITIDDLMAHMDETIIDSEIELRLKQ